MSDIDLNITLKRLADGGFVLNGKKAFSTFDEAWGYATRQASDVMRDEDDIAQRFAPPPLQHAADVTPIRARLFGRG